MEPTKELADALYREKVLRARELPEGKKIGIGIELFEGATVLMRAGIRHQFPGISEERVEEVLRERLQRIRRLDEHEVFHPLPA